MATSEKLINEINVNELDESNKGGKKYTAAECRYLWNLCYVAGFPPIAGTTGEMYRYACNEYNRHCR